METYTNELKTKVVTDVSLSDGLTIKYLDGTTVVKQNSIFCIPDYWYIQKSLLTKLGYNNEHDYELCASRMMSTSDDYDEDMNTSQKIMYKEQTDDYVVFIDTSSFWRYRDPLSVGDEEHTIEMKIAYKQLDTYVIAYLNYNKDDDLDFNIITCDYDGSNLSDTDTLKQDLESLIVVQNNVLCSAGYDNVMNNKVVIEV